MTTQTTTPETVSIVERTRQPVVVLDIDGPVAELGRLVNDALERAANEIQGHGVEIGGPPIARYLGFGPTVRAEVGFPVTTEFTPTPPLRLTQLPGGRAVMTTHVGPYETLPGAWERGAAWLKEQALDPIGPPWESYLRGPDDPAPMVTEIVWPVE